MGKSKKYFPMLTASMIVLVILIYAIEKYRMLGNFGLYISAHSKFEGNLIDGSIIISMFSHWNESHLFNNVVTWFVYGVFIERIIQNKWVYFLSFVISGMVANVITIYFTSTNRIMGSSASILGLCGLAIGTLVIKNINNKCKFFGSVILLAIVIISTLSNDLNISNTSHIAGLVSGLLISIIIVAFKKIKTDKANREVTAISSKGQDVSN